MITNEFAIGYDGFPETRKGYTGYEKDDESGLDFAQARYYNPKHGRYTSVDPLTASANVRNPQTFNRYTYVLNSPYKFSDPLGLLSVTTGACGRWCQGSDGGSGGGYVSDYGNNTWEDGPTAESETNTTAEPQGGATTPNPTASAPIVSVEVVQPVVSTYLVTGDINAAIESANARGFAGDISSKIVATSSFPDGGETKWVDHSWPASKTLTATVTSTFSSEVRLTVSASITLPQWEGYESATKEDRAKWDKFVGDLRSHEDSHFEIAVHVANEMKSSLQGLVPAETVLTYDVTVKRGTKNPRAAILAAADARVGIKAFVTALQAGLARNQELQTRFDNDSNHTLNLQQLKEQKKITYW